MYTAYRCQWPVLWLPGDVVPCKQVVASFYSIFLCYHSLWLVYVGLFLVGILSAHDKQNGAAFHLQQGAILRKEYSLYENL